MIKQDLLDYWKESCIITDKAVLDAFAKIPRESFVLKDYRQYAYDDVPLPTLADQTISQPTTVMIMTQALEVKKDQKILEVGSGSGYQAALLSTLVGPKGKVYTTEIVRELYDFAKSNLKSYKNVEIFHTDGSKGLKKHAPFDRIIVTAAPNRIPKDLIEQLKLGGILVIPVGERYYSQKMLKITKQKNQNKIEDLGDFVFVPLKES